MTTIKLPVRYIDGCYDYDGRWLEGLFVDADDNPVGDKDIAAALNLRVPPRTTEETTAPDLTALVEAARATLDWLGPVEKSPPMLPGSGLSEGSRLVAERNVLRGMLADALAPYEQKDGTP